MIANITKKTSFDEDCEFLRFVWREAQKAYCESRNHLGGMPVGQTNNHFRHLLNASSNATNKFVRVNHKFAEQYSVDARMEVADAIALIKSRTEKKAA